MSVKIVYLIFNVICMYAIFSFIDAFLRVRKFSPKIMLLTYIFYYLATTLTYFTVFNAALNVMVHLSFCFAIGFLYHATFFKRILVIVFIYILMIVSDVFVLMLLTILTKSSYTTVTSGTYLTCLGIILSMTSLLAIVTLVKPLFRRYDYELPSTYWFAVFFIPSGSIYILLNLNNQYINGLIEDLSFILITICILFAINILVFYLYNKLIRDETLRHENNMLQQQNIAYENQALLIQDFQSSLHDQKHDLKNYLLIIQEHAKQGQIDKLLEYVDTLFGMTTEIESSSCSGNLVIDTMINSQLYFANRQNTKFDVNVKLSQSLEMNQVHLTIILCNLLDNALEACTKLPSNKRSVDFTLTYQINALSIVVTNTYNPDEINIQNGVAYTTKTDSTIHGKGLKRIKKTVEKYDGTFHYYTKNNDDSSYFIAEAMFYPQSSKRLLEKD